MPSPNRGTASWSCAGGRAFRDGAGAFGPRDPLLRAVGRLLHVDDHERLAAWRAILESEGSGPISSLRSREHRLGLMLFAILGGRRQSTTQADEALQMVRESGELRREVSDLLDILDDRIRTVAQPYDGAADVPLASHATYSLGEIAAAYGRIDKRGALVLPQTGVLWDETTQTDLLFITLEKSDADFSPTTRYADYPISPTLFHWESQNSASARHRPPDAAMSSNLRVVRTSSFSFASESGMAGV